MTVTRAQGVISIDVIDNGPGVPPVSRALNSSSSRHSRANAAAALTSRDPLALARSTAAPIPCPPAHDRAASDL